MKLRYMIRKGFYHQVVETYLRNFDKMGQTIEKTTMFFDVDLKESRAMCDDYIKKCRRNFPLYDDLEIPAGATFSDLPIRTAKVYLVFPSLDGPNIYYQAMEGDFPGVDLLAP